MSNYSDSSFSKDPNSSWYKVYKHIKPKSKILDIGCSSGNFGDILIKEKGCIVDGIEIDNGDFKEAKKKLRNVWQLNVETDSLDKIKEKYDYLYFGDVIEHLVTPVETLERVKKLLKPEGEIVFSIPNMAHLSVRLMLLKGGFVYGETGLLDKTHFHFYTFDEIQRLFSNAGYEFSHLSPVLKDYPEEIIEQELSEVGLKSSEEFVKFTQSTQASIYQYVGAVRIAQSKPQKKKLDKVSPVDKFQVYLDNTKEHYEKRIELLEEQLASYKEHYDNAQKELEKYTEEIERLKKSFLYRARNITEQNIKKISKRE